MLQYREDMYMEMVRCMEYALGRFTANIFGIAAGMVDYADVSFNLYVRM